MAEDRSISAIGFTLFGAIDVDRDAVLSSLTVVTAVIVASALTGALI